VPLAARPRPKSSGGSPCLKATRLPRRPDASLHALHGVPHHPAAALRLSSQHTTCSVTMRACSSSHGVAASPATARAVFKSARATLTMPAPRLQALRQGPLHSLGALRDRVLSQRARHLQFTAV